MNKRAQDNYDYDSLILATCNIGLAQPFLSAPAFQPTGCATFVSPNEIVTCWHVLNFKDGNAIPKALLLVQNENGEHSRIDKLVTDPAHDLAYIKLKDPIGQSYISCASGENIDLSDRFNMLSCYGAHPSVDTSLIMTSGSKRARIRTQGKFGDFDVFLTNKNIRKGYSGSAILRNGRIYSVLSAKSLHHQGEIWAPNGYAFAEFIERARRPEPAKPEPFLKRAMKRLLPS